MRHFNVHPFELPLIAACLIDLHRYHTSYLLSRLESNEAEELEKESSVPHFRLKVLLQVLKYPSL
jgi:hypothetical protein